jgi:hypothetical protein
MLSLPKLALLIILVGIVWYGWKIWQRRPPQPAADAPAKPAKSVAQPAAEDLVPCRVCGTYIAAAAGPTCGRPDCVATGGKA